MAKIKLSSLIADLRGRLGTLVVSSNGAGGYLKPLKIPVNPRSSKQTSARDMFARLCWSWSKLSASDRADWSTYAAQSDNTRYDWFGDPYLPSARAQFFSINTARLWAGESVAETPPTGALPAVLPSMGGGIDTIAATFDSYISALAAFDASILWVHAALSVVSLTARTTPALPFRVIGIHATSGTWPWVVQSEVADITGSVPNNGSWWLALTPLSDEFRPGSTTYLNAPLGQEVP